MYIFYVCVHTYIYKELGCSYYWEKMFCRSMPWNKGNSTNIVCIWFLQFCLSRISLCIKWTFHWELLFLELFVNLCFCKLFTQTILVCCSLFFCCFIDLHNYLPLVIWIYPAGYKSIMLTKNVTCVRERERDFFTFMMNCGIFEIILYIFIFHCLFLSCALSQTLLD